MSYDVRRQWRDRTYEKGLEERGATEYYSVTSTSLAEMDNDDAVAQAVGSNGEQVPRLGQSHPSHRDLRVAYATPGGGLNERTVTVRYQWMPNFSATGGNDNPLTQKPIIRWQRLVRAEYQGRDIYGNPITNSAGDAVDPPPSIELSSRLLTILRWERGYAPEIADRFENCVNDKEMMAGGRRFPKGTVMVRSIMPAEDYATDAQLVRIAYELEIRTMFFVRRGSQPTRIQTEPFRFWHADLGVRSFWDGAGNTPGDLYHKVGSVLGEMVTEPVRLKLGAPMNSADFYVTSQQKTPKFGPYLPFEPRGPARVEIGSGTNRTMYLGWEIYAYDDLLLLGL